MPLKIITLFVLSLLLAGCYYDNEEDLFIAIPGSGGPCAPATAMYLANIAPIMTNYCTRCHRSGRTDGGVNIDGYAQLLPYVNNGRLLGAIRHDAGFDPMPNSTSKIPACDIQKITAWIDGGAPNN